MCSIPIVTMRKGSEPCKDPIFYPVKNKRPKPPDVDKIMLSAPLKATTPRQNIGLKDPRVHII